MVFFSFSFFKMFSSPLSFSLSQPPPPPPLPPSSSSSAKHRSHLQKNPYANSKLARLLPRGRDSSTYEIVTSSPSERSRVATSASVASALGKLGRAVG